MLNLTPAETRLIAEPFDFGAFDFDQSAARPLTFIAQSVPERVEAGIGIVDYPFPEKWSNLNNASRHPELAAMIKTNMDKLFELIEKRAGQDGIEFTAAWALDEILTNATQYGAMRQPEEGTPRCCGLVRMDWGFEPTNNGTCLELAISNPARAIFNPAKYLMMTTDEFFGRPPDDTNGHMGTTVLLGKLNSYPELKYVWHLPDGGKIIFTMQRMSEDEIASNPAMQEVISPVHRTVVRLNSDHTEVPYSIEQFNADADKLEAESVTVAFKI